MERLTQTSDKGGVAFTFDLTISCEPNEAKKILKLAEKLKEYEDLEEQGRLLRLPCDIGTRVYKPFIVVCREKPWIFSPNIDVHYITLEDLPEMGKKVFLTSQEADIKLNSMVEEYKASLKMEEIRY